MNSVEQIGEFCWHLLKMPADEVTGYSGSLALPEIVREAWELDPHWDGVGLIRLERRAGKLYPTLTMHGEHAAHCHGARMEKISKQLALPLSDNERAESFKSVRQLSVGNRFRLMYGATLLPDDQEEK